jgi:hypothetical protein
MMKLIEKHGSSEMANVTVSASMAEQAATAEMLQMGASGKVL